MLILLIFTFFVTFDISLQWWLLINFSWIFPVERLHSTDKNWLVLIICVVIIISFYDLVSLLEKNRDRYPLAVSQWLCKYICKSSMRTFITIPSNFLKQCLALHVIISEDTFLELVNSVSNSFECSKFAPGICVIYFSKVLDIVILHANIMLTYWINLTNGVKNKNYDWLKCCLNNPEYFISYGEIKATSKR